MALAGARSRARRLLRALAPPKFSLALPVPRTTNDWNIWVTQRGHIKPSQVRRSIMSFRYMERRLGLRGAAAALFAGAVALWLSAAAPSGAASAVQQQGTAVTVSQNAISWGSAHGCVQNMGTADFGSVLPGAAAQSASFVGCVTSNEGAFWGVSASATDLVGPAGTVPIPKANLRIGTIGVVPGPVGAMPCPESALGCSLAAPVTLFTGASVGTTVFGYRYALAVPASAAGGAYSGTVTFTASS
jgi:hypothetical protein